MLKIVFSLLNNNNELGGFWRVDKEYLVTFRSGAFGVYYSYITLQPFILANWIIVVHPLTHFSLDWPMFYSEYSIAYIKSSQDKQSA